MSGAKVDASHFGFLGGIIDVFDGLAEDVDEAVFLLLLIHTRWYMAAARLRAFGRTSKAASDTTLRIMSLAW